MLNTIGSLCGAETTGILDCVAYTAGVSGTLAVSTVDIDAERRLPGSCWALGVMHSGIAGSLSPHDTARHLQDRIQKSYLEMDTLDALVTPPLNKVSHTRARIVTS